MVRAALEDKEKNSKDIGSALHFIKVIIVYNLIALKTSRDERYFEIMMMMMMYNFGIGPNNCAACAMTKLADHVWNPP